MGIWCWTNEKYEIDCNHRFNQNVKCGTKPYFLPVQTKYFKFETLLNLDFYAPQSSLDYFFLNSQLTLDVKMFAPFQLTFNFGTV